MKIRFKKVKPVIRIKNHTYNLLFNISKFLYDYRFLICSTIWMVVIFLFSAQNAAKSGELSNNVYQNLSSSSLLVRFFRVIPIRKCGHLFLYTVLSIGLFLHNRRRNYYPYLKTIGTCYIYACLDELHQYFVDGRGASLFDTGIDLLGSLIGLLFISTVLFIYKTCKYYRNERSKKYDAVEDIS